MPCEHQWGVGGPRASRKARSSKQSRNNVQSQKRKDLRENNPPNPHVAYEAGEKILYSSSTSEGLLVAAGQAGSSLRRGRTAALTRPTGHTEPGSTTRSPQRGAPPRAAEGRQSTLCLRAAHLPRPHRPKGHVCPQEQRCRPVSTKFSGNRRHRHRDLARLPAGVCCARRTERGCSAPSVEHTQTRGHTQRHTDTRTHTQTHIRTHTQTHGHTRRHTDRHRDTRRHTDTVHPPRKRGPQQPQH